MTRRRVKHRADNRYKISTIITTIDGRKALVTFYQNIKNSKEWGTEVYYGRNYVVGSKAPSYSIGSRSDEGLTLGDFIKKE